MCTWSYIWIYFRSNYSLICHFVKNPVNSVMLSKIHFTSWSNTRYSYSYSTTGNKISLILAWNFPSIFISFTWIKDPWFISPTIMAVFTKKQLLLIWVLSFLRKLLLLARSDTVYLVALVTSAMFLFQWECEDLPFVLSPIPDVLSAVHKELSLRGEFAFYGGERISNLQVSVWVDKSLNRTCERGLLAEGQQFSVRPSHL